MTQSQALQILKTGANIFLTGEPGSGKTHTINEYVAYLRARGIEPAITASTGIAATHIGGVTIHSWSGIGIKTKLDKYDLDKIASNKHVAPRVKRAQVLIVDEVSMLSPKTLSMIDAVCRNIKQSLRPFGGIQIILVGDFFQLPPVVKTETGDNLPTISSGGIPASFAYESSAWGEANLSVCYLTEQHRQDDRNFLAVLSAIRANAFDENHARDIENRKIDYRRAPENVPKLFSHNKDVDRVNDEVLNRLPGAAKVFTMSSQGSDALVAVLKKGCLSPEALHLKTNAAVMFTKNNLKEGFVNGTLGTVEKFDKQSGYPIVKTRNGKQITVEPTEWAVEENGKIRARITQLPLRLAWAITVHKSQGISLDEAVMDLRDVFEFGQGYVALSRVRRLSGLYLLGWNERAFQVHPRVLEKDSLFRAQSEQEIHLLNKISGSKIAEIHERFIRLCGGKFTSKDRAAAPEVSRTPHMAHTPRRQDNVRRERRWELTLDLIQSGKTIADVARIRGRTEGTIFEHLESLRALGKLSGEKIRHLACGSEKMIAEVHAAFRELGTDRLSPVFEKLGGAYPYETLRLARLMLSEKFRQEAPVPLNFEKIREKHQSAYLPWNEMQDRELRELFVKGSPIALLAKTFSRTEGAIRSRLAKLRLLGD